MIFTCRFPQSLEKNKEKAEKELEVQPIQAKYDLKIVSILRFQYNCFFLFYVEFSSAQFYYFQPLPGTGVLRWKDLV